MVLAGLKNAEFCRTKHTYRSAEQASKNFQDDYELDFQGFLERTVDEGATEGFLYSNNGVKKAGR